MTIQASATTTGSSYRFTAWAAVTSGVIGVVAFGFLIAFLVKRLFLAGTEEGCIPLIRTHDAGVILQPPLMIPLVLTLASIAGQRSPGASRATVSVGVSALLLVVLSLLYIFVHAVPDDLYMIPAGVARAVAHRRKSALVRCFTPRSHAVGDRGRGGSIARCHLSNRIHAFRGSESSEWLDSVRLSATPGNGRRKRHYSYSPFHRHVYGRRNVSDLDASARPQTASESGTSASNFVAAPHRIVVRSRNLTNVSNE